MMHTCAENSARACCAHAPCMRKVKPNMAPRLVDSTVEGSVKSDSMPAAAVAAATTPPAPPVRPRLPPAAAASSSAAAAAAAAAVFVSAEPRRTSPGSATVFSAAATNPELVSNLAKGVTCSPSSPNIAIAVALFVAAAAAAAAAAAPGLTTRAQPSSILSRVVSNPGIFCRRQNTESALLASARLRLPLPSERVGIVKTYFFSSPTYSSNCSGGSYLSSRRLRSQRPTLYHAPRPHKPCEGTCKLRDFEFRRSTASCSTGGFKTSVSDNCGRSDSNNTPVTSRGGRRSLDSSHSDWWSFSRGSSRWPHSTSRNNNAVDWATGRHNSVHSSSTRGISEVSVSEQRRLGQLALFCIPSRWSTPAAVLFLLPRTSGKKVQVRSGNNRQLSSFLSLSSDTMMEVPNSATEGTECPGQEGVTLKLEPQEQQLFDMLMQCVKDEKLDVVLRAAGGWVRDKLLNLPSDDIDIAIDKMTGVEFAGALNRWLVARGLRSYSIGVVASNPEQSKHLETATCRLLGRFQVDFVHLRTETYSEGSRIPHVVTFGSPAEDASRRDFTINALFYNVKTRQVEDFTGTGLQDLRSGLLRAPLPDAEATFLDDPLRILRAVRFASRFKFTLHPDLIRAAQLGNVREALLSKVSRERVGIELKKMISGSLLGRQTAPSARDGRHPSLTGAPTAESLSPNFESSATTPHTEVNGQTSVRTSITGRTTTTTKIEELRAGDAIGGKMACSNSERGATILNNTSQAKLNVGTCLELLPAAARCVREAFVLLVRLHVVSCVFKLPERIFAEPISAGDGKLISKRQVHEHQQLVRCERDPQLQDWWVRGLHCVCALTTLLEHYFEGKGVRNAVAADTDENRRSPKSAVDLKFGKIIEQESVCFGTDFSDSHFRALMLGAYLSPMAGRFCLNGRSKREKLLTFLVVDSLKLSRKDADQVVVLAEGALAFLQEVAYDTERQMKRNDVTKSHSEVASQVDIKDCASQERIRIGLLIRSIGPSWRQALLIAAALLQTDQGSPQEDTELRGEAHLDVSVSRGEPLDNSGVHDTILPVERAGSLKRARPHCVKDVESDQESKEENRETATLAELAIQAARAPLQEHKFAPVLRLQQKIKQAGLEEAWKLQPLYDGHAVKDVLPNLPKGPIFKQVQDEQVRWQLANPSKASQDCALHLKEMYAEFS